MKGARAAEAGVAAASSAPARARRARKTAIAALALCLSACLDEQSLLVLLGPGYGPGTARFVIALSANAVPESLSVTVDGEPAATQEGDDPLAHVVEIDVGPGAHLLVASARFEEGEGEVERVEMRGFVTPPGAPALQASTPSAGAANVMRSEWLRLEFAARVPRAAIRSFALDCDGDRHPVRVHRVGAAVLAVNPEASLPAGSACVLAWRGEGGREELAFGTAAAGAPAEVLYDRSDPGATAPYPDDFYTEADASTATGLRLAVPVPEREQDVRRIYRALRREVNALDGFSPIGHIVFELSDALDPATIPLTPAESLDPFASVALLDLDPASEHFGERVPFRLEARDDTTSLGLHSFSAFAFPSIPLRPGGRYGFVVTRRAAVDAGRPFGPSPQLEAALGEPLPGEAVEVTELRARLAHLLEVGEDVAVPPIPRDDVALALPFTVRSLDALAEEMLRVREQVFAAPAPGWTVEEVEEQPAESPLAAVVTGTWQAPDFREGEGCAADELDPGDNFARDEGGLPVLVRHCPISFTLGLPRQALEGPVPVVMYQHGNPGSEDEVSSSGRRHLYESGFAVIGFTDILNRELSAGIDDAEEAVTAQVVAIVEKLVTNRRVADIWAQTNAEQLGFLRLIQNLGTLDVLPVGAPDGVPELDLGAPLGYVGISQGANHAPGFLPYAPEVRAAALVVGGSRLTEVLLHQQAEAFLEFLPLLFPSFTPVDIWAALAVFQTAYDRQDAHNHGRFLYRDPVLVNGSTTPRASVLLTEGLEDSLVANNATDSLAWQLGPIPFLEPVQRDVPFLEKVSGPVQANVDAETTAAYFQYVPLGVEGIDPTPGCVPPAVSERTANEGHYCAQSAAEARLQRRTFLETALTEAAPVIIDPFEEGS